MTILGIDPGVARTGWGIVSFVDGQAKVRDFGIIETEKGLPPGDRLVTLHSAIRKIVSRSKPEEAAMEKIFFNTNAKTALAVGEARGVTLLALTQADVPTYHYTPLQVKMAIAGYGRADKHQVEQMVTVLLNLKETPSPDDIADALAVAVTHGVIRKPR